MISIRFSKCWPSDDGPLDGLDLGDMVIRDDLGKADSLGTVPDQSMMIVISITQLLGAVSLIALEDFESMHDGWLLRDLPGLAFHVENGARSFRNVAHATIEAISVFAPEAFTEDGRRGCW